MKRFIVQIYEIQTPDEAEALILQITLADDTEDEMKKIATVLERNSLAIID